MTASSETLTTLRDRVELYLQDSGNNIWSTGTLDEAITQALSEYSRAMPQHLITTVTLASDTRELDVSSVTGLIGVDRVWLPYTAADPEHPAYSRHFEYWRDSDILYFPDDDEPQSAEVARVFYQAQQALSGLDGAAATTFPVEDEEMLITGSAGYAALSRTVDLTEKITISQKTSDQVSAWGELQLVAFRVALRIIAGGEALDGSPVVVVDALDKWDRQQRDSGRGWA